MLPVQIRVHTAIARRLWTCRGSKEHYFVEPYRRKLSTVAVSESRATIFSGIQPTGIPHLGNYLGALRQWVQLQNDAKPDTRLLYCIVDLHAITVLRDPEKLRAWRRETLAVLLASGLNPERSTIFFQSDVSAHSELMWILSCSASMGQLSRMTHWKSKITQKTTNVTDRIDQNPYLRLGLFSYPVLQAADIMCHQATHVPVGEDQSQHLEFARSCVSSFNSTYKTSLPLPKTMLSPAMKIMSLKEPHLKMSKSHDDPRSRIVLTDQPDVIREKIKVALTDSTPGVSYDPDTRPGVSNLIEILSHVTSADRSHESLAADFQGSSMRQFKETVADAIIEHLAPIQQQYKKLISSDDPENLRSVATLGSSKARESAAATISVIRAAVGLS